MNILWIMLILLSILAKDPEEKKDVNDAAPVTIAPTYKPVQSQKIKSFVQIVVKKNACSHCGSISYPCSCCYH